MKRTYKIEITLDWPETTDPQAQPNNIDVKVNGKKVAARNGGFMDAGSEARFDIARA
jgi:hypothetical protein